MRRNYWAGGPGPQFLRAFLAESPIYVCYRALCFEPASGGVEPLPLPAPPQSTDDVKIAVARNALVGDAVYSPGWSGSRQQAAMAEGKAAARTPAALLAAVTPIALVGASERDMRAIYTAIICTMYNGALLAVQPPDSGGQISRLPRCLSTHWALAPARGPAH